MKGQPNWLREQLDIASNRADQLPDYAKKEAGLPVNKPNWRRSLERLRSQLTDAEKQAIDEYLATEKPDREKDAERLAWLNKQNSFILHGWRYKDGGPEGVELRVEAQPPIYGATVEAVIDAAREAEAKGGRN